MYPLCPSGFAGLSRGLAGPDSGPRPSIQPMRSPGVGIADRRPQFPRVPSVNVDGSQNRKPLGLRTDAQRADQYPLGSAHHFALRTRRRQKRGSREAEQRRTGLAMNNPLSAAHQHHREATWFQRLAGGTLAGLHVLEVSCRRRGSGWRFCSTDSPQLTSARLTLDPSMVDKAARRLHKRGPRCHCRWPMRARSGCRPPRCIPDWRAALAEISRVLRPAACRCLKRCGTHARHLSVSCVHGASARQPVRVRRVRRCAAPEQPDPVGRGPKTTSLVTCLPAPRGELRDRRRPPVGW